ncbi:hypothetical protein SUDANB6_05309 [Streptomyces sp. enrichment culture]
MTGGAARARSHELIEPLADGALGRITVDVTVLGVVAFDLARGAAAYDEAEAAAGAVAKAAIPPSGVHGGDPPPGTGRGAGARGLNAAHHTPTGYVVKW